MKLARLAICIPLVLLSAPSGARGQEETSAEALAEAQRQQAAQADARAKKQAEEAAAQTQEEAMEASARAEKQAAEVAARAKKEADSLATEYLSQESYQKAFAQMEELQRQLAQVAQRYRVQTQESAELKRLVESLARLGQEVPQESRAKIREELLRARDYHARVAPRVGGLEERVRALERRHGIEAEAREKTLEERVEELERRTMGGNGLLRRAPRAIPEGGPVPPTERTEAPEPLEPAVPNGWDPYEIPGTSATPASPGSGLTPERRREVEDLMRRMREEMERLRVEMNRLREELGQADGLQKLRGLGYVGGRPGSPGAR